MAQDKVCNRNVKLSQYCFLFLCRLYYLVFEGSLFFSFFYFIFKPETLY